MKCHYLALVFSCFWGSAQAEDVSMSGNQLQLPSAPHFESQGSVLQPGSIDGLKALKTFLDNKSYVSTLRIEGHVAGLSESENQQLSEARAQVVAHWLIAQGIDCKRLIAVGFGSSKPVMADDTPEGRAANNRIDFAVAALRGRAIGGMPLDGGGKDAGDLCGAGQ